MSSSIPATLTQLARAIIPIRYRYSLRQLYYNARSLRYRGDGVFCPWCRRSFRAFLRYGFSEYPHLNTFCPRCNAFERHRLLWLYFQNKTNLFSAKLRVLHFAPEYMLQKTFKALPNLSYVSVDLDSPLAMAHMNITRLPFPDASFDVVLCSHVLEHVQDDRSAMAELFRVLHPSGWAIIIAPVDRTRAETLEDPRVILPQERARLYGQDDHVRLYGRDYISRLERAGFSVGVDSYASQLDNAIIALYGLNRRERIYRCTRAVPSAVGEGIEIAKSHPVPSPAGNSAVFAY
jgi:SAM-dependent methyltransferase